MTQSSAQPTVAPFGTWTSPISVDALTVGVNAIGEVVADADAIWWSESRPEQSGRTALMRRQQGRTEEITPPDANVRTRVHEYGGGAWWVDSGVCYYVDYADQRVYQLRPGASPRVLSPEPASPQALRFADFRLTSDQQWLIAVAEQSHSNRSEPENSLVALATDGSMQLLTLARGADFYQAPRLSPNGRQLAWIEWQHPNMPWDDTTLWVADIIATDGSLSLKAARQVAGGENESITQPCWSPEGVLHFLSDRSNYWQIYREGLSDPVVDVSGETGQPPWVFGLSSYAFSSAGEIMVARTESGVGYLEGFAQYSSFRSLCSGHNGFTFAAAGWDRETDILTNGEVVVAAPDTGFPAAFFPAPEPIEYATGNGNIAHALYFPPANPLFSAPTHEKPPLIVLAHGGPTAAAASRLVLARHFWTSRGFAVVDVNYRGSSGFGRAYRKQLEGRWGVADVEDCVNAAQFLVQRGDVDPARLIIRGGSAGGYTVLSALAFHDTFTAGTSLYGIADLEALAADTHKFESRYLEKLIGPYPQARELYRQRSPIHHLEGFTSPMLVLQGSEDKIVPPNQSRMIVDALDSKNIPVAYIEFAGEQHGFRRSESIRQALLSELNFYGRIFGFEPAGEAIELKIRNFPQP